MPSCYAVGAEKALIQAALRVRFSRGKDFIPKPSKMPSYCVTNPQQRSDEAILTLAGARLLMACAAPHIFEAVTAVFSCAGQEFTAKGKTVLAEGWKGLERRFMATLKKKADTEDDEENALSLDVPPFAEGQTFAARVRLPSIRSLIASSV